jgi:hypothetical protein
MKQYLLSIYQPDGAAPSSVDMNKVMEQLGRLNEEMKSSGGFVFTGGLDPAEKSSVVRPMNGATTTSEGPYTNGKEHIGGIWVVGADDEKTVMAWASKAAQATTLPIEVRPFQHAER